MGVAVAMARHAELAHAEGEATLADRDIVHERHQMHGRIGIIRAGSLSIGIAIET